MEPARGARGRAAVAALLIVAGWTAAPGASAAGNTLRRPHDPVVVSTARLASLPTRHTASLRLYRIAGGRPVPVAFQVDARDAHGDVVVDGPLHFEFDHDDELVFMASDTGDRLDGSIRPAGWEAAVEIEVLDPRPGDGGRGWAYLASCTPGTPAAAFEPYVTFDTAARQARSAVYQVEYAPSRNFFTGVRLRDAAGGGVDLLRQSRMRGSPTFSLLFGEVTLDFTEQDSRVSVDGVRVGPVRAVRRARLSIDLGALFPDLPGGTAYTYHYRTAYLTPSRVGFSWMILKALRAFRFENVLEFLPSAMPLRYFDRTRPDGVPLDGLGTEELRTAGDHEWWAHSGDSGTILHALVIPERWRDWGITRGTVLRAGPPAAAGEGTPPRDGASAPVYAAGYTLEHMTALREAGSWDLLQASVVLPAPFRPGDEEDALALVRAPLQTDVRVLR